MWKVMVDRRDYSLANVPDHLPPLAFGTKGCSAADVPKVPKAWWLSGSAR
jgi:predicted NAD/FAD-binding protein